MIEKVRKAVVQRFEEKMWIGGIHGPIHWERVHENGIYLAKYSGADLLVVELFAFLHDSCRENDGADPQHGYRAAKFAETLRDTILNKVSDDQFSLLTYACEYHDKGRVSDDPTIGTCWDSDRLDLGRVGIRPKEKFLSTDKAGRKSVIDWAYCRSTGRPAKKPA